MVARNRALSVSYLTDTLPTVLPPIFEQAQHTTANHRKNLVALRKIHDACAGITAPAPGNKNGGGGALRAVGEKAFNDLFVDMVNRVLQVKKGVAVADRVVKFVASYVAYTTEQDLASRPEGEEDFETHSTRFVSKLLKHLLSGMEAKDKNVRFRVTLLTASMINGLGEMDDDMYQLLRKSLLQRASDKEPAVRSQAVLGLLKLQSGEDEEELEEGQEPLIETLLFMLRCDPAAEVRRAALYNMPRTPQTLPHILARTRDIDPIIRRTVYAGSLSAAALPDPRVLSIAQREEIVRNGLGDREPTVRKAAAGMLGGWLDHAEGDLLEFLSRFDVVGGQVAEDALLSIFVTRGEVFDNLAFSDEYWATFTPEKAFLARVFAEHCAFIKDEARIEASMPVVTDLTLRIQDEFNTFTTEEDEDKRIERSFIVGELLGLAMRLDYADEIGRRKMFTLAREMISLASLPQQLIPRCMDVLSKISNSERDLIRVVVDVVTELREGDGDVDDGPADSQASTYSATPRKRRTVLTPRFDPTDPEAVMQAALTDLRCLLICISLLERVNSTLQANSVLEGLIHDLINPAVRNKDEPALRDQGLICLGLCALIDSKVAKDSFGLFYQQFKVADDELKASVVRIMLDVLMVHDLTTLTGLPAEEFPMLIRQLIHSEAPDVQAVACEGAAKLMLAGMLEDENVLQSLVLLYFSPETADNQALRQCLAYFLPVYSYSSPDNQRRLLSIFSATFKILGSLTDEQELDADTLPLAQMGLMMVDWLDPEKVVQREGGKADPTVHLDLAVEILTLMLTETSREMRKALLSFLSKLNLPEPEEIKPAKAQLLAYLTSNVRSRRPFSETAARNALNKFDAAVLKKYSTDLEGFSIDAFASEHPEDATELVELVEATEVLDVDAAEAGKKRRGGSRQPKRSGSRESSVTMSETTTATSAHGSDGEGDEEDEDDAATVTDEPITPRRSTRRRESRVPTVIDESDEEDDEEDEDEETGGRAAVAEGSDSDDVESILDEDDEDDELDVI